MASVFKGSLIYKSSYKDGSLFKQRTQLIFVKDKKEFVVAHQRIVESKEKPDNWHHFARCFNGKNYWTHETAIRLEKYLEIDNYLIQKMEEISQKINEVL